MQIPTPWEYMGALAEYIHGPGRADGPRAIWHAKRDAIIFRDAFRRSDNYHLGRYNDARRRRDEQGGK